MLKQKEQVWERLCAHCGEKKSIMGVWCHDTEKDRWFCDTSSMRIIKKDKGYAP